MSDFEIGQRVRVISHPALTGLAEETKAALLFAVGREFEIKGFGRYGHLELELGPLADQQLGGYMNTIWLEPEHVVSAS